MDRNNKSKNKSPLLRFIQELLLPEIVTLVVAWVLAILTNNTFLKGITVLLQFVLIVFTPVLVWEFLRRMKTRLHRIFKTLVCALLMLSMSTLFSTLTYARPIEIPSEGQMLDGSFYIGKYLRGSSGCRQKKSPCLNQVRVERAQLYRVQNDLEKDELRVMLDVNWSKWEKFPTLPRNYKGRIYYKILFECDSSSGIPIIEDLNEPKYSMAPESIILSYLIGFVEIPFVFSGENTIPAKVTEIARDQEVFCS